ncbi:MAG: hypothetical protein WC979_00530 [Candidatus Pacearchaeota archaeon]|jgi:hypothetical protein|nr:hypothetical protein [Clostridia bacterium]
MKQRFKSLDEFINESAVNEGEINLDNKYALVCMGGSIGRGNISYPVFVGRDQGCIVETGDDKDAMVETKKRRNKTLSPGEKSYYGMSYKVIEITNSVRKTIDSLKAYQAKAEDTTVAESTGTASIVPGAIVDIMGMKGVVTEITQFWNETVYGFDFKNEAGENHSAIFIGDKYILRESEDFEEVVDIEESVDDNRVYFVSLSMPSHKYVVKHASKNAGKDKTGSVRYKTEAEAQTAADKLNAKNEGEVFEAADPMDPTLVDAFHKQYDATIKKFKIETRGEPFNSIGKIALPIYTYRVIKDSTVIGECLTLKEAEEAAKIIQKVFAWCLPKVDVSKDTNFIYPNYLEALKKQ